MKTIQFILLVLVMAPVASLAQTKVSQSKPGSQALVEAYYFHNTARCVTCKAVESEARQNMEVLYPELFRQGKMSFQALNLEEQNGKIQAKKLGVTGQCLLLVRGDRKVDLTNEGFLYARTNPVKLKSIMKEKIDGLMGL